MFRPLFLQSYVPSLCSLDTTLQLWNSITLAELPWFPEHHRSGFRRAALFGSTNAVFHSHQMAFTIATQILQRVRRSTYDSVVLPGLEPEIHCIKDIATTNHKRVYLVKLKEATFLLYETPKNLLKAKNYSPPLGSAKPLKDHILTKKSKIHIKNNNKRKLSMFKLN